MVNRGKTGIKERLNLCTRGKRLKSRNNTTASQHSSRRAWRKVENSGIGRKKLLVARNDKRGREIYK